jgi:hypothetical protein
MKMLLLHSLAAAGLVTLIASAGPTVARGSEASARHRDQSGRAAGPIVLAERATKSKTGAKLTLHHVILKGYDPVAYFKQGRPVKGNPSIVSTYHGATYLREALAFRPGIESIAMAQAQSPPRSIASIETNLPCAKQFSEER